MLAGLDENQSTTPPHQAATPKPRATTAVATAPRLQLSMFEPVDPTLERIRELLQRLDINTLTPIEALMKLHELKIEAGKA